jgi:hypothetical protein
LIQEVSGDLFSCPSAASLGHCISADIAMGKGKNKYLKIIFVLLLK